MDVKLYKCPNCGADLKFDPDKQLFCCDYCLGEFNQQQINQMIQQQAESQQDEQRKLNEEIKRNEKAAQEGKSPEQQMKEDEFSENTRLYQCPSCGAEIVSDMNTAASFCYFCHNFKIRFFWF